MAGTVEIDAVQDLREALERIKNELGVPGDGYPANVANAWFIADAALRGHRFSEGDAGYASEPAVVPSGADDVSG